MGAGVPVGAAPRCAPAYSAESIKEMAEMQGISSLFCQSTSALPAPEALPESMKGRLFEDKLSKRLEVTAIFKADSYLLAGSTATERAVKACVGFKMDASYALVFDASVKADMNVNGCTKETTAFKKETSAFKIGTLRAPDTHELRGFLTKNAKKLLEKAPLALVFEELGPFYVKTVTLGGSATVALSTTSTKAESASDLTFAVAGGGGRDGLLKAGASIDFKCSASGRMAGESMRAHFSVTGGIPSKFNISKPFTAEEKDQPEWAKTVMQRAAVVGLTLGHVSELASSLERKEELAAWHQLTHRTFTYESGDVYTGQFSGRGAGSQQAGRGVYKWKNGNLYDGEWRDDQINGHGTTTLSNGTIYVGQHARGIYHGQGVLKDSTGSSWAGQFVDGKIQGQGVLKKNNGAVYEGQWVSGQIHGQGVYKYADTGGRYEGQWVNGKGSGQGSYTWPSGSVWAGPYVDGSAHGWGTFTSSTGKTERLEFKHGEKVEKGWFR